MERRRDFLRRGVLWLAGAAVLTPELEEFARWVPRRLWTGYSPAWRSMLYDIEGRVIAALQGPPRGQRHRPMPPEPGTELTYVMTGAMRTGTVVADSAVLDIPGEQRIMYDLRQHYRSGLPMCQGDALTLMFAPPIPHSQYLRGTTMDKSPYANKADEETDYIKQREAAKARPSGDELTDDVPPGDTSHIKDLRGQGSDREQAEKQADLTGKETDDDDK